MKQDHELKKGDPASHGFSVEFSTPPMGGGDREGRTIHLVENHSDTLLSLFEFLSEAGFRVAASSDAMDALDYIARHQPDVVISSAEMKEVAGFELIERVRDISPATRVILMSSCSDWAVHEEVRRRGGTDVIPRSAKGMVVLRAVERALEARP